MQQLITARILCAMHEIMNTTEDMQKNINVNALNTDASLIKLRNLKVKSSHRQKTIGLQTFTSNFFTV
jgi:hypothetical protein